MSIQRPRRYDLGDWCIDMTAKPWQENVAGALVFAVIAMFGYGTIQEVGANPWVIIGVFGIAGLYLFLLFGQRLDRVEKGEYVVYMRGSRSHNDTDWHENDE